MIPNWLLKEYADIFGPSDYGDSECLLSSTAPAICSENGRRLTRAKKETVLNLKKDKRPFSLTPCISKVAEGFVVDDYLKLAVWDAIDSSQDGAVPKSSTTSALLKYVAYMVPGDRWKLSDCKIPTVRLSEGI